jgi:hypothetical protein
MLPRLQAFRSGRFLAEMQKAVDLEAEGVERAIVL